MILVRGESLGKMTETEVQEFIGWARDARSTFDSNIIGYPRCAMLISEKEEGALAYMPCQTVIMAEAFIPKPDASAQQKARSLLLFDKTMGCIARSMDVGDVYAYTPVGEAEWASQMIHHGWKEIENVRLFKKPTGVKV